MKLVDFSQYVGSEVGVSRWFSIDQERINGFAVLTEDCQGIHVDADIAASSPFGSRIAHGFLILSMLSAMVEDALPPFDDRVYLINYGFDKIRFVSPVPAESRVRAKFTLLESRRRERGVYLNKFGVAVEVEQQSKPGLVAEWLTLERTADA